MDGWTFLVARGRRKGYQSLLVPDFLAQSNEYGVLGQATGDTPGGGPTIARVHGLAAGDVVLTYRTERLSAADLDAASDGPLTDEFGRPLELLYGFVVRGGEIGHVDDADFATARAEAIRTYRRFLADESSFELERSTPFTLRSTLTVPAASASTPPEPAPWAAALSEPIPAHPESARVEPVSAAVPPVAASAALSPVARRNVVLVAVLILALSAAAWFVVLRGGGGPVTQVEISEPTATTIDCTSPITVQAKITTDSKATVVYHWESTLTTDSGPAAVAFPSAGTRSVQTTVQPHAASGAPLTFAATLVIDEPNSTEASRKYILTCK